MPFRGATRSGRLGTMELDSLTTVVTRADLVAAGYVDNEVASAVRRGSLCKLARGVYGPPAIAALPLRERYPLIVRAVAADLPPGRAVAGTSALALHGLPLWGMDLSRVHLADAGRGSGTRTSGVVELRRDHRPMEMVTSAGISVVSSARAVVDTARRQSREAAVATGDAAMFGRLCTHDDLFRELALLDGVPGAVAARRAVRVMDARSESVLESRSRLAILDAGMPAPIPQYDVYDGDGSWVARVDFAWPELMLIGESDGELKYAGDVREVLAREKYRADRLMELGWRIVRWGWHDLAVVGRVPGRIDRVMHRSG